jgi:hypothetical protein
MLAQAFEVCELGCHGFGAAMRLFGIVDIDIDVEGGKVRTYEDRLGAESRGGKNKNRERCPRAPVRLRSPSQH